MARVVGLLRRRASTPTVHDIEYNAIREAAALIDVSPLYKYLVTGPDALRLVDRVITRDATKLKPSAGSSTRRGATSTARSSTTARSTASTSTASAGPRPTRSFAGCAMNARGLDVDDRRRRPRRPPRSRSRGRCRAPCSRPRPASRSPTCATSGAAPRRSAGVAIDVSRTGYTGDLGYELWIPAERRGQGLGRADEGRARRSASGRPGCSPSTSSGSRPG